MSFQGLSGPLDGNRNCAGHLEEWGMVLHFVFHLHLQHVTIIIYLMKDAEGISFMLFFSFRSDSYPLSNQARSI